LPLWKKEIRENESNEQPGDSMLNLWETGNILNTIRRANKSGIILLFLGIILFEMCGCYILPGLYQIAIKYSIRQQIKNNIPAEKIRIIKIPVKENAHANSSFSFKNENECWYEGKLYDIITVKQIANFHLYYCLFDEKETALITWFMNLFHQKFSLIQDNNPALNFILYISTLFCTPFFQVMFQSSVSEWIYSMLGFKKYQNYILPYTPPPKISLLHYSFHD